MRIDNKRVNGVANLSPQTLHRGLPVPAVIDNLRAPARRPDQRTPQTMPSRADPSMHRRSLLTLFAAAAVLPACGDSHDGGSDTPRVVTGRIDPALLSAGLQVGSARGPSTVSGDTFSTTVSDTGVGILALEDAAGRVRGFTLTFPGDPPAFSPEATALATIFLQPGIGTVNPAAARALAAKIQALPEFADYVALLRNRVATPLDLLGGDVDFIGAREAVVQALGSQLPQQGLVTASRDGTRVILSNPSQRVLRVIRRDASGDQLLQDLLPPSGLLVDHPAGDLAQLSYIAAGAGHAVPGQVNASVLDSTYGPTIFSALTLPILELLGGNPISEEDGLRIYAQLEPLPVPDFSAAISAESTAAVGAALDDADTAAQTLGGIAAWITGSSTDISKLVTAGAYVAGLAFTLGAIMKFKQHKDNPTQIPVGTPIALVFIAAALLFLPSILSVAGGTLFGGDSRSSVAGEPFAG